MSVTPTSSPLFGVTRRAWLIRHTQTAALMSVAAPALRRSLWSTTRNLSPARVVAQEATWDPEPLEMLVRQAVEAATAAGASYADARLTRTVRHTYEIGSFIGDVEDVGVGVRALVHGYWGFAGSPEATPEAVVRLARDAVALATENAKGGTRTVELGAVPATTGRWATPVQIDPFMVPVEEKLDYNQYWIDCIQKNKALFRSGGMIFMRQERVLATSAGTRVTQTVYETSGWLVLQDQNSDVTCDINRLDAAGRGWELFLDAKIPEQIPERLAEARAWAALGSKPLPVGRYTIVLDGATMASVVDKTLGVATQLDRALGYEANASGTSFLDDPLAMVGHAAVASPLVTVTANRSAPTQLATVQWDDEGVAPEPFPLVKDGVVVDFQTTREQAAWLAPYYQQHGRPVRSHGCAAAQDALFEPLQMMPNLVLEPSRSTIRLEDVVAEVPHGILIEKGGAYGMDFQARTGLIGGGRKRLITNGRLGKPVAGGAVLFNTADFWKNIQALGGPSTVAWIGVPAEGMGFTADEKGEPAQRTSYSVSAVAALIPNQPVIDPAKKA